MSACRIGGPEVKSANLTGKGSLCSSPAASSSACAPVPAWSPTISGLPPDCVPATVWVVVAVVGAALELLDAAGLLAAALLAVAVLLEPLELEPQAATPPASERAASAAAIRRG